MSPVFLHVEIPSSPGPAGQCNDSLIISSVCLSVCGVRVSLSVHWCKECTSRPMSMLVFVCMHIAVCVCVCVEVLLYVCVCVGVRVCSNF